MYTYTWYQWLTIFYLYCSLDGSSSPPMFFLKTEAIREPRLSAAANAAVIRKRRSHDVMGISPVSGQPDPHLYLRRYRCHGSGVRDWICDGAAFQSPLLGLQQPALLT